MPALVVLDSITPAAFADFVALDVKAAVFVIYDGTRDLGHASTIAVWTLGVVWNGKRQRFPKLRQLLCQLVDIHSRCLLHKTVAAAIAHGP